MKIIKFDNYIKIGDRFYPPNSYIVSTVDDDLVVITTLDNNINVTLAWTQFTDVNDDPYASLNDVIIALLSNNAFPPVVPADTITGTLTAGIMPKASGTNTIANSQVKDNGVTVYIGAAPTSAKALFDLISTTKGFFMPRMTTAQQAAIGAGAADIGLMLFNLDLLRPTFYDHVSTSFKKLLIPEDVGNITVASTVTPAGHTGDTNETILGILAIPAGMFIANDEMVIRPSANTLGTGGTKELKLYLNTTPDLTGTPIQIARMITGASAVVGIKIIRHFDVENSNLIKDAVSSTALSLTDYVNNGAFTTYAPDLTVIQYLIATGTLTSGGDTINLQSLRIIRNRV